MNEIKYIHFDIWYKFLINSNLRNTKGSIFVYGSIFNLRNIIDNHIKEKFYEHIF